MGLLLGGDPTQGAPHPERARAARMQTSQTPESSLQRDQQIAEGTVSSQPGGDDLAAVVAGEQIVHGGEVQPRPHAGQDVEG